MSTTPAEPFPKDLGQTRLGYHRRHIITSAHHAQWGFALNHVWSQGYPSTSFVYFEKESDVKDDRKVLGGRRMREAGLPQYVVMT